MFGFRTKTYAEIFQNPSPKEMKAVPSWTGPYRAVRGVIDKDKNLYVWDADVLHSDVLKLVSKDPDSLIRFQIKDVQENVFEIEIADMEQEQFSGGEKQLITAVLKHLFPGKKVEI